MEVGDNTYIHAVLTEGKTLKQILSGVNVSAIEKLTISGEMNYQCFKYIHDEMASTLLELDMENVSVTDVRYNIQDDGYYWIKFLDTRSFKKLESITLSASMTKYIVYHKAYILDEFPTEYSLFNSPALRYIGVHEDNPNYQSIDGVLFDKKGTLVKCPPCMEGHYVIPNFVITIESEAFCDCLKLKSVHIPDSVQKINLCSWFESFRDCSAFITIDSNNPKYKGIEGRIYEK